MIDIDTKFGRTSLYSLWHPGFHTDGQTDGHGSMDTAVDADSEYTPSLLLPVIYIYFGANLSYPSTLWLAFVSNDHTYIAYV